MCHKEGKVAYTTHVPQAFAAVTWIGSWHANACVPVRSTSQQTALGSDRPSLCSIKSQTVVLFPFRFFVVFLPRPTGPRLGQRDGSFAKDQKIVFGQTRHVHFLDLDESRPFNLARKGSLIGPQMLYHPSGVV
jgi:hypothetical protein